MTAARIPCTASIAAKYEPSLGARYTGRPTVTEPSRLVAEDARLGHDQAVVRLDLRARARRTEATDGAVDQLRVRRRELVVPDSRCVGRLPPPIDSTITSMPARQIGQLPPARVGTCCRARRSSSPCAAGGTRGRSTTDRLRVARPAPRRRRSRPGSWSRAGPPCPGSGREHADRRRLLASTHPSLCQLRRLRRGRDDRSDPAPNSAGVAPRRPVPALLTVYESTDDPVTRQGGHAASETCIRPARLPPMTLRMALSSRPFSSSTKVIGSDIPSGWG